MEIKKIQGDFTVCKVTDYSQVNLDAEFCFTGKTDEERSFTIDEIIESMDADASYAIKPGKSTLYRLLPSLVEAGTVHRFTRDKGCKAAYQIVGGRSCHSHMHMKCNGCGRLLHMSDSASRELMEQIEKLNQFHLDLAHTLLYGTCSDCAAGIRSADRTGGLAHE